MCEYLYAQFSLKRGPDEGVTPDQFARVHAWEAAPISVIKQQVLHLAPASNILTALGAAPHLGTALTAWPVGPSHPGQTADPPSTSPALTTSCCLTTTAHGRSSMNGLTCWQMPARPSATDHASARWDPFHQTAVDE